MQSEVGDWIVGPFVAILGLIGIILFGRANDGEMTVFGAALALFAIVFIFSLIKRRFEGGHAVQAAAKGAGHE